MATACAVCVKESCQYSIHIAAKNVDTPFPFPRLAPHATLQTRAVLAVGCLAMFGAAVQRVAFSVLAVPIQAEFGFSLPEMGMLQSALLGGYVLGQVGRGRPASPVQVPAV